MDIKRLITMANQIAANIAPGKADAAATEDVASHLKRFWDPRMRRQLIAFVNEDGGTGLNPVALKALHRLQEDKTD
ncbi:MAG: formate dehydrogenase [Kordiimonas sp.]|nr:formate dehydrogenase [Kordiimonas sp.]|tara:strand:- start:6777 stop:7004 length:228 start_codon:yes stop_codon:yes gene_type:complete